MIYLTMQLKFSYLRVITCQVIILGYEYMYYVKVWDTRKKMYLSVMKKRHPYKRFKRGAGIVGWESCGVTIESFHIHHLIILIF